MIDVSHISKKYGAYTALSDLSFHVGKGEVLGFLGPNGAGKSTTLRILSGYFSPSSGHVKMCGFDMFSEGMEAKKHVGYMPESVPMYQEMRVMEYLAYRAEVKLIERSKRRKWILEAMDKTQVTEVANVKIGHLSKGFRQRVGLSDALLAKPSVLLLDEPSSGLDPNQMRQMRALIQELRADHTIVFSTHLLSEVEEVCTKALVLRRGKLVAHGSLSELRALVSSVDRVIVFSAREENQKDEAYETYEEDKVSVPPRKQEGSLDGGDRLGSLETKLKTICESLHEVHFVSLAEVWKGRYELRVSLSNGESQKTGAENKFSELLSFLAKDYFLREARPVRSTLDQMFSNLTEESQEAVPLASNPRKENS